MAWRQRTRRLLQMASLLLTRLMPPPLAMAFKTQLMVYPPPLPKTPLATTLRPTTLRPTLRSMTSVPMASLSMMPLSVMLLLTTSPLLTPLLLMMLRRLKGRWSSHLRKNLPTRKRRLNL